MVSEHFALQKPLCDGAPSVVLIACWWALTVIDRCAMKMGAHKRETSIEVPGTPRDIVVRSLSQF